MKLVLLLNMGGARNTREIFTFLKNMFSDEAILPIRPAFLRKIVAFIIAVLRFFPAKKNYAQIGGKSPLDAHTRALVAKLNERYGSANLVFDYAYNYTPPYAADVLARYGAAREVVLFPLYPHESVTTSKSSIKAAMAAVARLGLGAKITCIEPFFEREEFNEMVLGSIFAAAKGERAGDINVIFSAHSLPKSTIARGDLYEAHVRAHFEALRARLGLFKSVSLAYQSRLGPVEWLGPNIADVIAHVRAAPSDSYAAGGGLFGEDFEREMYGAGVAGDLGAGLGANLGGGAQLAGANLNLGENLGAGGGAGAGFGDVGGAGLAETGAAGEKNGAVVTAGGFGFLKFLNLVRLQVAGASKSNLCGAGGGDFASRGAGGGDFGLSGVEWARVNSRGGDLRGGGSGADFGGADGANSNLDGGTAARDFGSGVGFASRGGGAGFGDNRADLTGIAADFGADFGGADGGDPHATRGDNGANSRANTRAKPPADPVPTLLGKRVLIYPISFCIDNSETDFELAIQYANAAKNFDFYRVARAQNSSDEFAKFIFECVFEQEFYENFGLSKRRALSLAAIKCARENPLDALRAGAE